MTTVRSDRLFGIFIGALVVWLSVSLAAQSVVVSSTGLELHLRAPGFTFIEGVVLDRLRDGRSVRIDLELTVYARPGGAAVAHAKQSFNLSFDLWEERFAATRVGAPRRSVSHLTRENAEAWCLQNLTVPRSELTGIGPDTPFWIRLQYAAPDEPSVSDSDVEPAISLRKLIDVLSQRPRNSVPGKSVDAGPFRLTD
jgi:hypothetical protein